MVKVANAMPVLGYLRDIRLSGPIRAANGKASGSSDSRRSAEEAAEELLQSREQAGYERGRQETEERRASEVKELRREWEQAHRAEVVQALESINRTVQHQVAEMFKSLERHVILLAAESAIKLTAGIPISADMVEAYVREALSLVAQDTEITILVSPEDLALLEQFQSSLLNCAGTTPVLRFRADAKVSRGGCLLQTKFGELDARRETKIELLKRAVNE